MTIYQHQVPGGTSSNRARSIALGVVLSTIALLVIAVVGAAVWVMKMESQMIEGQARNESEDLDRQIQAVRAGKQDSIHLYCTHNTDALLVRLAAEQGVKGLKFELTDVTDAGMDRVAALPNLKTLVIYGGRPGIGNSGFARLKPLATLEDLSLVNTLVTDEGLRTLSAFPKLQSLTMFHEAWRGQTFSDAGLDQLESLTSLQHLELSGGWVSPAAAEKLRGALPECEIKTRGRHHALPTGS